jgi:DNA-binding NtrC family response regulator
MGERNLVLAVYRSGEPVARVRLGAGALTIGRGAECDVVLADRKVSSQHARLSRDRTAVVLTDLKSSLGTLVNGLSINTATINAGDEIAIGPYQLRIVDGGEKDPPPPPPVAPLAVPNTGQTAAFYTYVQELADFTDLVGIADLHAVLQTLLERTMKLLEARAGFVLVPDQEDFAPLVAGGAVDDVFSRSACRLAAERQAPLLLTTAKDFSATSLPVRAGGALPAMVLAMPLLDGTSLKGVLYLEADTIPARLERQPEPLLAHISRVGGRALQAALERHQLLRDSDQLRWLASMAMEEPDLVRTTTSPAMTHVVDVLRRTAPEELPLLILGETGTGKDVTARTLHRLSGRAGPFVPINCAAIPKELLEAELFGYEKGAFSGAEARKPGWLELANGGTLLLDEIGELPRELQAKLLRVLESRLFTRVGGTQPVRWNARLVAATNANLAEAVAAGTFRADLYYRINVVTLELPSLRDRREDIEGLAHELLLISNQKLKKRMLGITPEALAALEAYDWPGNVRELRNVLERAFVLEHSDRITVQSLSLPRSAVPRERSSVAPTFLSMGEFLTRQETEYLRVVLDHVLGNVADAARILGLSRTALYRRLKQLGLRDDPGES